MSLPSVPVDLFRGGDDDTESQAGVFRDSKEKTVRVGRANLPKDTSALFPYVRRTAIVDAVRNPVSIECGTAAVMDADRARNKLHEMHVAYGVDVEMEAFLYHFDKALMLTIAINGASEVMPVDRVTFRVDSNVYDLSIAWDVLRTERRRWVRRFIDVIVANVREILDTPAYGPYRDLRDEIFRIAELRGVPRYPVAALDSAEFCATLSYDEKSAAKIAKSNAIGNTENVVDRRGGAVGVQSRDRYVSGLGDGEYHN